MNIAPPKPSSFTVFRIAADLTHLFSILLLGWKMKKSRSCAGISLKTQILFGLVYLTRYLDVVRLITRFEAIKIYNFSFKVIYILAQCSIIWAMKKKFRATYDPRLDSFPSSYLVGCSAIIAFLVAPKSFYSAFLTSVEEQFWTFSIVLESVAIFPQLFMLYKTGEAENITTHYLFSLGAYRGLYVLNWMYRYLRWGATPGWIAFLFGVLQTGLYGDFFYLYYKNVLYGKKFQLLPH